MKLLPLALLSALVFAQPLHAQDIQQFLTDGQVAYSKGDLAAAKKNFKIVLEADPKNQLANNFLRMIQTQEAKAPKGNDLEKRLSAVIMPKVEMRDASLASALDYLRGAVTKVSAGKESVNFVVQLPESDANTAVTLSLTNIPFTEVLKYLGSVANVQFTFEKYAVRVTKVGAPAK